MSSAGQSHVGFPSIYESQNQRHTGQAEIGELRRTTGENVQGFLPKDQQNEVNRLHEEQRQKKQAEAVRNDPTLAANLHGNRPSRGALVDRDLQKEDEAILKKKNDAMTGKKF
ncbi:hypothetical protein N656DRAFT_849089 [Canariomyces notabilis]|uniref:Uncharacterized protein n=1 Tax=Canariomyces notabilis TaxID=2074819 RepID=A0AAN6QE15_9PEZI|nr:hypothetical protein N656DRAFT_849089 [Canariomyces arenarius]